jgi:hypothetical protein
VAVATALLLSTPTMRLESWLAGFLLVVQLVGAVGYTVGFQKTAWDEAAGLVAAEAQPGDVVFVLAGNTEVAFDHYFDPLRNDIDVVSVPWRIPDRESIGSTLSDDDIARLVERSEEAGTTWLVLNSVGNIPNSGELAPALRNANQLQEPHAFYEVRVIEFR